MAKQFDLRRLYFPMGFLALIWAIHLYQVLVGVEWGYMLGIKPLAPHRWFGIFTGPLVHGDWPHLLNNTVSFAGLSFFLFYLYPRIARRAFVMIYLMTTTGVWLFGKDAFHIGASGLIYGMAALLFWMGIFRRNIRSVAISLVVLVLYSGMFYGFLPQAHISYESHIIGAIAGVFAAYYYKEEHEPEDMADSPEPGPSHRRYFLPRDAFEKTKYERYLERQSRRPSPPNDA